jgi:hypothetical protein
MPDNNDLPPLPGDPPDPGLPATTTEAATKAATNRETRWRGRRRIAAVQRRLTDADALMELISTREGIREVISMLLAAATAGVRPVDESCRLVTGYKILDESLIGREVDDRLAQLERLAGVPASVRAVNQWR